MNSIKQKVQLYGIRPEMVMIDNIIQSIFNSFNSDCRRTSGVGKKHKERSLHYPGYAIDYGTKEIGSIVKHRILAALKNSLPQCDIILEYEGKKQEHIHVEFDPKNDMKFQEVKAKYKLSGTWPE